MKQATPERVEVTIDAIVPGGQGIGSMPDGRKIFVWNALPSEHVAVRLIKQKRTYCEGIAEEILRSAPERTQPLDENYLATSPWQMMSYEAENRFKHEIVTELVRQEHMDVPVSQRVVHGTEPWHYRNKMEYSFWGDDAGIHLAFHQRGSRGKQIVTGSSLAMPAIDAAANAVTEQLNTLGVRAGDLKTIVVRCNQRGDTVAALFVKPQSFPAITLPPELKGLRVYHSNPRSPASVPTKLIAEQGTVVLEDSIAGHELTYDVDSFFQVNIPIFEKALMRIKQAIPPKALVDMYAGVGSIGLTVAEHTVTLVELDAASAAMARHNASKTTLDTTVIETSSEQSLEYITSDVPLVVDPPRAGLHHKLIAHIIATRPPVIAYLSCNPATQLRDLALLQDCYEYSPIEVFNFFPRTPHIETLVILRRR